MAIDGIFETSKRALYNSMAQINNTSTNIANVDTEGYKRRQINTTQMLGYNTLDREAVTRIVNQFLENRLNAESSKLSKYESDETLLTQIEDLFAEPDDSALSNVMTEFWNSWNDLATDPESQTNREVVKDKAEQLSNTFHQISADMDRVKFEIGSDLSNTINDANSLIQQIGQINAKIAYAESADLLDQRDQVIEELSNLLNVEVRDSENGLLISTDGQILVSGSDVRKLDTVVYERDGYSQYKLRVEGSNEIEIESGKMSSLLDIYNNSIPEYMSSLNTLAVSLAQKVNAVHVTGYNLSGITGINFFSTGITGAANFTVNSAILEDASLIATSASSNSSGDGSIAQAIYDLQTEANIGSLTFSQYYNNLITSIGNQVEEAADLSESQSNIVLSLQNQRDSVSGVSLDEEMTYLIQYEQSYQAASKLLTTVQDMVDTLLSVI